MDGTTLQLLLFAGAVGAFALAQRRQLRARADELVRRSVGAAAAAFDAARAGLQSPSAALSPAELKTADGLATRAGWSAILNRLPDDYPHVLIIGPTGAGKTTFATALLAERPGRLVVITPKPDDSWGGLPVVTIDDDASFTSVREAFEQLLDELRRRLVAVKHGQPAGEQLTIVLDDTPALVSEAGRTAADVIKLVGRQGRSLRVRLVVLSQSDRVKALALEGEGDALANFTRVVLERGHRGRLQSEGRDCALDLRDAPRVAAAVNLAPRAWLPPAGGSLGGSLDELEIEAGAVRRPAALAGGSEADRVLVRPNERTNERTALAAAAERLPNERTRAAVVAALVAAGWNTTAIRELLRGTAGEIGDEVRAAREALDAQAGDV